MQDVFLTVNEAARRLSVTPYTLREWLKSGKIHGVQISRRWRVPERELIALSQPKNPPETSDETANRRRAAALAGRGMFAGRNRSVDEFLAERRAEGEADYIAGVNRQQARSK